jgi:glycosyltransferase involved in cell wall biosynthesis
MVKDSSSSIAETGKCRMPGSVYDKVSLLTGGGDKPYAFGLATALLSKGVPLDVIGSDELDLPEFHDKPGVTYLNLRGDQRPDARLLTKLLRVLTYYLRLIRYARTAEPNIFHILWNNKLEFFDRTLLMAYYRRLRKNVVLTIHNVNAGKRDSKDTAFNRLTLRIQYRLADHIFVHTEKMKLELASEYGVPSSRVTVIPFGINNAVPNTSLTPSEAKERLGLDDRQRAILFFGNLVPYKGVEYLIAAFRRLVAHNHQYRLVIAGSPATNEDYWPPIRKTLQAEMLKGQVFLKDDFIPDAETELYFKAADVLVLPYTYIYQSGVLFLGHSFGLPVIASDVGCLKDEIVEGQTGFLFRPKDTHDLARAIETYFESDLYSHLDERRGQIRDYATRRHSWDAVSQATMSVYANLSGNPNSRRSLNSELSKTSEVKSFRGQSSVSSGRMS